MENEYAINGEVYDLRKLREFLYSELAPEWRYLVDYIVPNDSAARVYLCSFSDGAYRFDIYDKGFREYCDYLESRSLLYLNAERYAMALYPDDIRKRYDFRVALEDAYCPMCDDELSTFETLSSLRKAGFLDKGDTFVFDGDSVVSLSDSSLMVSSPESARSTTRKLYRYGVSRHGSSRYVSDRVFARYFDDAIRDHYRENGYKLVLVRIGDGPNAQD